MLNRCIVRTPVFFVAVVILLAAGTISPLRMVRAQQTPSGTTAPAPPKLSPAVENVAKEAETLVNAGKMDEAVKLVEAARAKLSPKTSADEIRFLSIVLAEIHTWWANLARKNGDNPTAIKQYEAAYAINKTYRYKEAINGLGDLANTYDDLSQYQKAIGYYEQVLAACRDLKDRQSEGVTLTNLGDDYASLGQYQKAVGCHEQALVISRERKDREAEGRALNDLGNDYAGLNLNMKAIGLYDQALVVYRERGKRQDEGGLLNALGDARFALSQYATAADCYEQALLIVRETKDRSKEGIVLSNLGKTYTTLKAYDKATVYYEQALVIYRDVKNQNAERVTLSNLGMAYDGLKQYEKAAGYFEQSLVICRETKDRQNEGYVLNHLGEVYGDLHQNDKAVAFYEQALGICRERHNRQDEGTVLNNLTEACLNLGQFEKAITWGEEALVVFREVKDRSGEAMVLNNLGGSYDSLSQYEKAIGFYGQSLVISQEIKDKKREGTELNNLGNTYTHLSQYEKAIGYLERSLIICREAHEREGEAASLNNLGQAYDNLSQYEKAVNCYKEALVILREVKNRKFEATVLNNVGMVYSSLSQYAKSIDYVEQSLLICREIKERLGEAGALNNLGYNYRQLKEFDKALNYFEQALFIIREIHDRQAEGVALGNLGETRQDLHQPEKAALYYEQALGIFREVKDRQSEGMALNDLGDTYEALGQQEKALDYYGKALTISREVKGREVEGMVLGSLLTTLQKKTNPHRNLFLAAFWGKQAVNVQQSIRRDMAGLDKEMQKTYLDAHADTYRALADVLVSLGRLPEAQEVLGLLKNDERFDFVRRDATRANAVSETLALTPAEAEAKKRYDALAGDITRLGAEQQRLEDKKKRFKTLEPADATALADTNAKLILANTAFAAFLNHLSETFTSAGSRADERSAVGAATEAKAKQAYLTALSEKTGSRTVLINFLVGKDRTYAICTTPSAQTAQQTDISAEQLNALVAKFRIALTDPTIDPLPLAKKLYDLLLKPLEADLAGANAQTLLVTLDGTVRYIPLAALSPDGKTYLIEKYRIGVQTGKAFQTDALNTPPPTAKVLALGVTQAHTVTLDGGDTATFNALPGVREELAAIHVPGSETRLDEKFQRDALMGGSNPFPIVHVASHFHLGRSDADSYLLLGDGTTLSLRDLTGQSKRFAGIDLLFLSACDTATGGILNARSGKVESNGGEVDSFASIAQEQGAQAVLASLWPVSDSSTALLLTRFYAERQAHPDLSKTEILRRAQMALLTGEAEKSGGGTAAAGTVKSGSAARTATGNAPPHDPDPDLPPFAFDAARPKAHPYYWAPFVLIGNVR